jgi:transcriptional regulator with XRE-family HTH domain
MELGKRIDHRLKALRLTQVELAQKSGLTQQVISQYIRGKSKPGYDAIVGLLKALEVNSAWFFEESEPAELSSRNAPLPQSEDSQIRSGSCEE